MIRKLVHDEFRKCDTKTLNLDEDICFPTIARIHTVLQSCSELPQWSVGTDSWSVGTTRNVILRLGWVVLIQAFEPSSLIALHAHSMQKFTIYSHKFVSWRECKKFLQIHM